MSKKVLVGISYGVDSFVAKNLLMKDGYEVIDCNLDINDKSFDKIKKYFVDSFIKGITPNICTYCNRYFKFYELNKKREELNLDYYATGHYANVVKINNRYAIKKSKNQNKDQSYMLYNLTQDELKYLLLPIGDMDKSEVRNIAAGIDKTYAEKKDSLNICFIEKTYVDFIKEYILGKDYKEKIASGIINNNIEAYDFLKKGPIYIDSVENKPLSYHDGIINYTVGKRIYIEGKATKYYVKTINPPYIIASYKDKLYTYEFTVININFMLYEFNNDEEIDALVRVTYRAEDIKCKVKYKNNKLFVKLDKAQIVSKGQAAVFYNDDGVILFGGEIE